MAVFHGNISVFTRNLRAIVPTNLPKEDILWYEDANRACWEMAEKYDVPVDKVIGIVAVLSPMLSVRRNFHLAEQVLKTKGNLSGACLPNNAAKANRIYHAEKYRPTKYISGDKVRAFYANIRRPQTTIFVTVDRHAINAVFRRNLVADTTWPPMSVRRAIARAYKIVAKELGIPVAALQAIVWVEWKRIGAGSANWSRVW